MIIDGHCHAWRRWPYDPRVPDPQHRGSVDVLLHELDRNGVERAAVVCARIGHEHGMSTANDDNNEYVASAARRHRDRLIVVADVDSFWRPEHHRSGAARRLREAAERYELRAFTHYVHDANDGWFTTETGAEFFATAAELDLVASLAVAPPWFDAVRAVAHAQPTMPILLHHVGLVRLTSPAFDEELAALLSLAGVPSVHVKVSGFHYLSPLSWDFPFAEALRRVLRPVSDAFGAHRLIWGSDFPAARDHVTYTQSLSVVRDHTPWWSTADRDLVLGGTLRGLLDTGRPAATASAIA